MAQGHSGLLKRLRRSQTSDVPPQLWSGGCVLICEKRGNWLCCLFVLRCFLLHFTSLWQHIVTDVKRSLKVH